MEEWNYKIKDDTQFKAEILRIYEKYNLLNKVNYHKGQQNILETLRKIKTFVFENKPFTHKEQYGYLLHYLEYEGGKEFLETRDGKDIVEIFFYFAYKWGSN